MSKINGHRVFSHSATFYISHYNSYIELLSPYKYSSTPCLKSTYIIPYKFYGGLSIEVLPSSDSTVQDLMKQNKNLKDRNDELEYFVMNKNERGRARKRGRRTSR